MLDAAATAGTGSPVEKDVQILIYLAVLNIRADWMKKAELISCSLSDDSLMCLTTVGSTEEEENLLIHCFDTRLLLAGSEREKKNPLIHSPSLSHPHF